MEPATLITNLCKQKAGYMAHKSADDIHNIDAAVISLIYIFTLVLCLLTIPICIGECPKRSDRKPIFYPATTIVAGIAVCHATYILGEQARFYCIDEPGGPGPTSDWVRTGFLLGVPGLCMMVDWLFLLFGALYDGKIVMCLPPSVGVVVGVGIAVFFVGVGCLMLPGMIIYGILMVVVWMVDGVSSWLRGRPVDGNDPSPDLEAASETATLVPDRAPSDISTYGTNDVMTSKKAMSM